MTATLAQLERFAFIALDLAEATRKVHGRQLFPREAMPFVWLLDAFEEQAIRCEVARLTPARQQEVFRLLADLTAAIDRRYRIGAR